MYFSPLLLHFWLVFVKTCLTQVPQLYWISIFNHRSVAEAYRRITHIGHKVRRRCVKSWGRRWCWRWRKPITRLTLKKERGGGARRLSFAFQSRRWSRLWAPDLWAEGPRREQRREKTLNSNWVNEQRTVGETEEEELRPNSSTLEKQATMPIIFLRKTKVPVWLLDSSGSGLC